MSEINPTTPEAPIPEDDTLIRQNHSSYVINNDHLSEYEPFFIFDNVSSQYLTGNEDKEYDLTNVSPASIYKVRITNLSYGEVVDRKPVFAAGNSYFVGVENNVSLIAGRFLTFAMVDEEETPFCSLLKRINNDYKTSYTSIFEFEFPLNLFLINKNTGKSLVFYNVFFSKRSSEYDIKSPDRDFIVDFFASNCDSCNIGVRNSSSTIENSLSTNTLLGQSEKNETTIVEKGGYVGSDDSKNTDMNSDVVTNIINTSLTNPVLKYIYNLDGTNEIYKEIPFVAGSDGFVSIPFVKNSEKGEIPFFILKVSKDTPAEKVQEFITANLSYIGSYANAENVDSIPPKIVEGISSSIESYKVQTTGFDGAIVPPITSVVNPDGSVGAGTTTTTSYVITTSNANFRSTPNTTDKNNYKSTIPKDTVLKYLENVPGQTWTQLEYNKETGYVYSNLLRPYKIYLSKADVNLRSSFSTKNTNILQKLPLNSELIWISTKINSDKETWHECYYKAKKTTGWVLSELVTQKVL